MNEILSTLLYLIIIVSLIIASYYDIKKRRIWYLIFVPALIVSLIINVLFFRIELFSVLSIVLFGLLFLATKTRLFITLSALIAIAGSALILLKEPALIVPWVIEIIFANMVIGEVLFGVGDIKALVLIIFSTANFYLTISYSIIRLPFSIIFFLNLGFSSVIAMIFSLYYTYMKTGKFSYRARVNNNKDISKIKFRKVTIGDSEYVSYNIPFMVFITIAFILTVISVSLSTVI